MRLLQGVVLMCVVFLVSGCSLLFPSTINEGPQLRQEKVNQIIKGTTKKADIIGMFGLPMNISHNDAKGENVYLYEHVKTSIMWNTPKNYITRLRVIIDAEEKVTDYTYDELLHYGAYYQSAAEGEAATSGAGSAAADAGVRAGQAASQRAIQNQIHAGPGWH